MDLLDLGDIEHEIKQSSDYELRAKESITKIQEFMEEQLVDDFSDISLSLSKSHGTEGFNCCREWCSKRS